MSTYVNLAFKWLYVNSIHVRMKKPGKKWQFNKEDVNLKRSEVQKRYSNAQKALETFKEDVPELLIGKVDSYKELKEIEESVTKMSQLLFCSFFEPKELEQMKEIEELFPRIKPNEKETTIFDLIYRYDRVSHQLERIADTLAFKFQNPAVRGAVRDEGYIFISSFFNEEEYDEIMRRKDKDSLQTIKEEKKHLHYHRKKSI